MGPTVRTRAILSPVIGQQVRQARVRKKLSQEMAAQLAGVSRKLVWKVENDQPVMLEEFRRVITALEMPAISLGGVTAVTMSVDAAALRRAATDVVGRLEALIAMIAAAAPEANAPPVTREQPEIDVNAILAAAAVPRPVLSADDPVLRQLQDLVDQLAAKKAEGSAP
jgi:transcriptional regulator with XRE-family HTH domain